MLRALIAFSSFEIELFFQTFVAVIFTYVAPSAIFLTIVGRASESKRADMVAVMEPVVLGIIILFVSFYTLATEVVGHREMGFYKRILVTRVNPITIALSNAILGYVLVFIGLIVLTAEAWIIFRIPPHFNLPEAIAGILFAGGAMFLFGMIPACFVKRTANMFAIASVSSYVLVCFSGFMPNMGRWTAWLAYADQGSPAYHALRVLRAGFAGDLLHSTFLSSILFLAAFMAICLFVIRRFLSWM